IRGRPHSCLMRIDIRVETQNSPSLCGARREGIDMQEIVTCRWPQPADRFLQGAKACLIRNDCCGVFGEHPTHPTRCLVRKCRKQASQALGFLLPISDMAAQGIYGRIEMDVLLGTLLSPRQQEDAVVAVGKWEGARFKDNEFAAFQ